MTKAIGVVCVVLIVLGIFSNNVFANGDSIRKEIEELKARIFELERKLEEQCKKSEKQEKVISKQEEKIGHIDTHILHKGLGVELVEGLKIGAGATFVVQGTIDANNTTEKNDDVTDASYSIDLELEKTVGDVGLAFIHLEAGGGNGVDNDLDIFSNVNRDADNDENVRLTEAWYEHNFFDGKIVLKGGKLDPTNYLDENAIANDETRQFLGSIFRNSPVIEFCDNGPGVKAGIFPADWLELSLGCFDGDTDWEEIGDTPFTFVQLNLKPGLLNREGNYRFYGWYNDTPHTKLLVSTRDKEDGYGAGLSFDQELTDVIGLFARFGWQDRKVYEMEYSWSSGLELLGTSWGREKDLLGVAIGQILPGDDYKDAQEGRKANNEGHFEAYYSAHINDNLTLSPDIQIIWNPKGDDPAYTDRTDTITVLGVRGQVDF